MTYYKIITLYCVIAQFPKSLLKLVHTISPANESCSDQIGCPIKALANWRYRERFYTFEICRDVHIIERIVKNFSLSPMTTFSLQIITRLAYIFNYAFLLYIYNSYISNIVIQHFITKLRINLYYNSILRKLKWK